MERHGSEVRRDACREWRLAWSVFWRGMASQCSQSNERMMGNGFMFALEKPLRALISDDDAFFGTLKHMSAPFNMTPHLAPYVFGIAWRFERDRARGVACDAAALHDIVTMLASSLSAVGDAWFWGTFRAISLAVGAALALGGNPVGSLLYAIAYSTVNVAVRAYLMSRGLNEGLGFIERLQRTGLIDRVTRTSQMIAFAALGGLAAVLADGRGCLMGGPSDFLTGILACQDAVLPRLAGMVVCGAALVLLKRGARVETIMAASIVACLAIEGFVAFWA